MSALPSQDLTPRESQQERCCEHCGRRGLRSFFSLNDGRWLCLSAAACERRLRATGVAGIGVMAGYRGTV